MSWINLLTNSKEIRGVFPDDELSLENLTFLHFKYETGSQFSIAFLAEHLPTSVPVRWIANGVVGAELLFRVGAASLEVNIPSEFVEFPRASVSVLPGAISVVSSEPSLPFHIRATSFYASLRVTPIDDIKEYLA